MKSKAKKLAKLIGGEYDKFSDNSGEWVVLKNEKHQLEFFFEPSGELSEVAVCERVFVEDEPKCVTAVRFDQGDETATGVESEGKAISGSAVKVVCDGNVSYTWNPGYQG